jgi:ferredoxin-type protein NapH
VLGGALLSTAIFGFPVFCLVCPIGLIFATLIGLWRLIQFNEPTWTLLIFPAVLVLELAICRRWCGKLCPLGALLSLVSSLNVFVRPRVDKDACLRTAHGVDCKLCKGACLEGIDLHQREDSAPLAECTKCRECSDSCPVNAIRFPFFAKKEKGVKCPD